MKQIDQQANIQTLRKLSLLFKETYMEIDESLRMVMDAAADIVEAKKASLLMVDEKNHNLQFYQASGEKYNKGVLKNISLPYGKGLAGTVAKTGKALVSNDVQNDKRWYSEVSQKTKTDVHSIACFPLVKRDKVIGVVQFLDKKHGGPFQREEIALLEKFSLLMAQFFGITKSNELLGQTFNILQEKYYERYTIVGESPAIKECVSQAEKVADSKAAILLTGESGTGKELVAHLIHNKSNRQTKPFISISCGALPGSLLERELFGHEKGAFTGADTRKIGLFEAADSGTLFLDEIGEMPLDMQVKLLRVIQEESFMRLGGTSNIKVDVRIISATNQDLEKMVREGKFRQDLYYRINVINVKMPHLRDRREDIPDLVTFFLKKHTPEGKPIKPIQKGLLAHLMGYHWPGNIRELENSVERAVVLSDKDELSVECFPLESSQPSIEINVGSTLKEANDSFRRTFITNTLKSTAGNRTKAAKILDVQRSYLSRLIKELNIS